jgi:hypothetical protein
MATVSRMHTLDRTTNTEVSYVISLRSRIQTEEITAYRKRWEERVDRMGEDNLVQGEV